MIVYFDQNPLKYTFSFSANDFLYSSSQGAKQIPFATAGDCYSSSASCPQVSTIKLYTFVFTYFSWCTDFQFFHIKGLIFY